MTITVGNQGTAANGTTSATPTYPTVDASSIALLMVASKPFGAVPTVDNADWALLTSVASGAVANAADTGSVQSTVRWQTGNVSGGASDVVSVASGSPTLATIWEFDKTANNWCPPMSVGLTDTTETGTTVAATTATHLACATGDMLVWVVTIKDDAPNHTSQSVAVPGCTLGSTTWVSKISTTTGNDAAMYIGTCTVTAGTSTGTATYSATSSVSGASSTAVVLVRLREAVNDPVTDQTMRTLHLVRSTDQSIATATETAISWSSATNNTTTTSWWSSGAPTQIVLPWTGLYFITFHCCWEGNNTGLRAVHVNDTTTIADANIIAGSSHPTISTGEDSAYDNFGAVIDATAGDIILMTVFQNSGGSLNLDNARFGNVPAAQMSISYLEG